MRSLVHFFSLLFLCLLACKQKLDEHTVYQFLEVIQLKGMTVGPENLILKPYRMTKIGDYLVLNDEVPNKSTNCMLYLYCTQTQRVVKNFGSFGDGPGELKDISDFHVNIEETEIVVYDQLRKTFCTSISIAC